jgi:hypothetical protein
MFPPPPGTTSIPFKRISWLKSVSFYGWDLSYVWRNQNKQDLSKIQRYSKNSVRLVSESDCWNIYWFWQPHFIGNSIKTGNRIRWWFRNLDSDRILSVNCIRSVLVSSLFTWVLRAFLIDFRNWLKKTYQDKTVHDNTTMKWGILKNSEHFYKIILTTN